MPFASRSLSGAASRGYHHNVIPADVIRLPALRPAQLLAVQTHLLEAAAGGGPVLLLFQLTDNIISLGRYHIYGGPQARGGISAYRRLTGGRIITGGRGWTGCSIVSPSRTAPLSERDARLRPEQVMNRYVRGAIAAIRDLGADCFYPGRDAITCNGRELALCTFEETAAGAMLFELFIAVDRGLEAMPSDMEIFDPSGALTCPLYDEQRCTCLARELGRGVGFEDLADRIETGYGSMFGRLRRRDLNAAEGTAMDRMAPRFADAWTAGRFPDASMRLSARQPIQLGFIEARMAAAGDHIEKVELYGDFIANSCGLAAFEHNLMGKRLDPMTLTAAALQTYGDGRNFILGCGDFGNLAAVILKAS